MGILNTVKIFWLPAVAPALWNLTLIIGIAFFRDRFAIHSDILPWSVVAGGILQAAVLIPSLKRQNLLPRFRRWWGNPAVRRVLRSMGPSVLGLSVMQLAVIINTYFASQLEEGSNSWIMAADRILEFPLSLFAVSVGTAALPTLSALWSRGDRQAMSEASLHALRLSLFMALPCAVGMYVLAQPIVYTLFEHGKFGAHDTMMVSKIIQVYGLSVIFATAVRVLAPAFYAMKNTWLPAAAAAIALVCHVIIASILTKSLGVVGLAMSTVISGGINFFILMTTYQFLIAPFNVLELLKAISKFVLASAAMGMVGLVHQPLEVYLGTTHLARVVSLTATVGLCVVTYFAVGTLLRTVELTETTADFRRRIAAKISRKKN